MDVIFPIPSDQELLNIAHLSPSADKPKIPPNSILGRRSLPVRNDDYTFFKKRVKLNVVEK